MIKNVNISDLQEIKENPSNPRTITESKFERLVESLKKFPQMLEARPIVVNKENIVLGGNMRLRAAKKAGLSTVPVFFQETWSEEQEREFIIKDNLPYGDWDWDMINANWDVSELEDWGMEVIKHDWDVLDYIEGDLDEPDASSKSKITVILPEDYIDERGEVLEYIKDCLKDKYEGCEVK